MVIFALLFLFYLSKPLLHHITLSLTIEEIQILLSFGLVGIRRLLRFHEPGIHLARHFSTSFHIESLGFRIEWTCKGLGFVFLLRIVIFIDGGLLFRLELLVGEAADTFAIIVQTLCSFALKHILLVLLN